MLTINTPRAREHADLPRPQRGEGVPTATEREWIRRLRAGDEQAFETIFHAYYNALCHYSARILRCEVRAEEVVEDVFCRIWEQRSGWEIHSSLTGYLYNAVRNRALRALRHERVVERERDVFAREGVSPAMGRSFPSPEEALEAKRLEAVVEETLQELPARAREAFVLQRSHALSYAEVAEAMGISVSTVEKHMIRAIGLLRRRLLGPS